MMSSDFYTALRKQRAATLYQRLISAGVLTQRELDRYKNLNELSKNSTVVLDRFSLEFSNEITARIELFLQQTKTAKFIAGLKSLFIFNKKLTDLPQINNAEHDLIAQQNHIIDELLEQLSYVERGSEEYERLANALAKAIAKKRGPVSPRIVHRFKDDLYKRAITGRCSHA